MIDAIPILAIPSVAPVAGNALPGFSSSAPVDFAGLLASTSSRAPCADATVMPATEHTDARGDGEAKDSDPVPENVADAIAGGIDILALIGMISADALPAMPPQPVAPVPSPSPAPTTAPATGEMESRADPAPRAAEVSRAASASAAYLPPDAGEMPPAHAASLVAPTVKEAIPEARTTAAEASGCERPAQNGREGPAQNVEREAIAAPPAPIEKSAEARVGHAPQGAGAAHLPAAQPMEPSLPPGMPGPIAAPAASAHPFAHVTPGNIVLVPAHVESPDWSKDFGRHVIRLASAGEPAAEIHLNPPDWGPIRVSIELNGTDATLSFGAEHLLTREALEGALPRLREMFAAENLTLAGANVSTHDSPQFSSGSQGQRFDSPSPAHLSARALPAENGEGETMPRVRSGSPRSQIDLFA